MKLSFETKKILEENGWFEERKINISKYILFLASEGYEISDKVKEFLEIFGGLHFKLPEFKVPGWTTLHFDPVIAAENIFKENIESYEQRVGEHLTPIGEAYNGYYTLMISSSGKMYGAFEDTLRKEGDNYEEGIESLYKCVDTPEMQIRNS